MAGHVVFTYCDHEAEEFLTLGQSETLSADDLNAFYESLPPPNDPDSPFLADLWSDGETHDDDKAISALGIELYLSEPLDVLMARARAYNRRYQLFLKAKLSRTREGHPQ